MNIGPSQSQGGVLVAQLGARKHYAAPRILHEAGILYELHTDLCASKGWLRLADWLTPECMRPDALRRALGRKPEGIPPGLIRTHDAFGVGYGWIRRRVGSRSERTAAYLWAGRSFCKAVFGNTDLSRCEAVYAFSSAALELLKPARFLGCKAILEQAIAPKSVEMRILEEELTEFGGIEEGEIEDELWREYADREAEEWKLADAIFCASPFVVDSIREAGGPADKAVVVPYGVDWDPLVYQKPDRAVPRNRVLFVGQVGLRKGAHYLIEAARLLEPEGVRVRLVGPVQLNDAYVADAPSNVEIVGAVPRSDIAQHYEWADVFCLPSLCEGSATVTYEALAAGLPVVTTPNAGSIVTDGVDGFVVPIRNAGRLASAILKCRDGELPPRPELMDEAPAFAMSAYADRLLAAIADVLGVELENAEHG